MTTTTTSLIDPAAVGPAGGSSVGPSADADAAAPVSAPDPPDRVSDRQSSPKRNTNRADDATAETVRILTLLAGGGAASSDAVEWVLDRGRLAQSRSSRTCLDGGSQLVVAIGAPGGRRLRLFSRVPGDRRRGVTRLASWSWDGNVSTGWRHLYSGEPVGTWADIGAAGVDVDPILAAWHRILGPNGRIYSLDVNDRGPAWVGWQLDPGVPIGRALAALGLGGAWPAAEPVLTDLLGFRPPDKGAPWSLAVASDASRWRIGTSRWARCPEDAGKRRRLADTVSACGGDRSFAEGVYKVVLASSDVPSRVGRAAEVEFLFGPRAGEGVGRACSPQPVGVEFFLASPVTPSRLSRIEQL
jgi:hypothetical protein